MVRAQADVVFSRLSALQLEREPLAAAAVAARWVNLDRLNEAAWQRLILARLGAGQRSLAREALEACRTVLPEELGLELTSELLALEAHLLKLPDQRKNPDRKDRSPCSCCLMGRSSAGKANLPG